MFNYILININITKLPNFHFQKVFSITLALHNKINKIYSFFLSPQFAYITVFTLFPRRNMTACRSCSLSKSSLVTFSRSALCMRNSSSRIFGGGDFSSCNVSQSPLHCLRTFWMPSVAPRMTRATYTKERHKRHRLIKGHGTISIICRPKRDDDAFSAYPKIPCLKLKK